MGDPSRRFSQSFMQNATVDELKAALSEVLDERRSVSEEQHKADHAFLAEIKPHLVEWLEAQKHKQERYESMMNTIIGGLVVALLGWIGVKMAEIFSKGLHGG